MNDLRRQSVLTGKSSIASAAINNSHTRWMGHGMRKGWHAARGRARMRLVPLRNRRRSGGEPTLPTGGEERGPRIWSGGHETVGLLTPGPHHGHELLVGHWLAEDIAL